MLRSRRTLNVFHYYTIIAPILLNAFPVLILNMIKIQNGIDASGTNKPIKLPNINLVEQSTRLNGFI
jgi:hypothetical protein